MTGWRLGWLVLPAGHEDAIGKPSEFNTSCAPVFVQRGGLAGLQMADAFVPGAGARLQACRDRLLAGLQRLPRREAVAAAAGGMYAFFQVAGEGDSLAFAKRLVTQHGLGLARAPPSARRRRLVRWCFAAHDPSRLDAGMERLASALRL